MSSGYYPPGAENDPRAPYNQVDPPEEEVTVTVSITMSKTMTVTVPNPGHWERDEDGVYYESEREHVTEDQVREQHLLPDDILRAAEINLKLEDAEGWNVDECEVVED